MNDTLTYKGLLFDLLEWLKKDPPHSLNEKHKAMLQELHFEEKSHSGDQNIIILKMGKLPSMFKIYPKSDSINGEAPDHAWEHIYRLLMCNGILATVNEAIKAHKGIMKNQISSN